MLTFELAKQLKENHFPIKTSRTIEAFTEPTESTTGEMYARITPELSHPETEYLAPTLSELIEACGEQFGELIKYFDDDDNDLWFASNAMAGSSIEHEGKRIIARSKTPEEAVAKLWLALNSK